jgi:hypothetical protein
MATTTTNYGFDIPQSTDLVKDGATAIATLGQDIDTAMNTALGTKKAGMVLLNTTSFSGVASQSINNVFSSTYQYYKIVWSVVMSNSFELNFKLRVSGSDATNNYNISQVRTSGVSSSTASQETNIPALPFSYGNTSGIKHGEAIIFNPFLATKTGFNYLHYSENNSSGVTGGLHTESISYTGATFSVFSGTITGEIFVYGFNK